MPSTKNTTQLDEIKDALKGAKAVILTNYSGLSVAAQNDLRQKISAAGGSYHVFKNTLLKLALKDAYSELPETAQEALQGQTAILIAPTDPVAPTKALMKFRDDNEL